MILNVLALGFILSLDNFRTSVALGGLRLRWRRAAQVAVVFGLWDFAAPLAGLLVGHYVGRAMGPVAGFVGPAALAAFGGYLIVQALRTAAPADAERRWSLFGLPLPLSVDNLIAGASLGLLSLPPWVSASVFGTVTALMSFAGLQLGRVASYLIPRRLRWDLVTGVALIVMALVLALRPG